MIDEEIKLLHDLFLKLGLTVTLALFLFGLYFAMARRRARKVPMSFFALFIVTLGLYVVLILDENDLIEWVDLPKTLHLWTRFVAYLGTAFFLLKGADLVFVEDYLIRKKGLYIPDLLRLLIVTAGIAVAALIFLRIMLGIDLIALVAIPTVLTAVIGLALQDTIKSFFAGLMLGKLVRVGDAVILAGREGRVVNIDLSHVTILTDRDDLIMIPNNVALQQDILNHHKPTPRHARSVSIDAGYDTPPLEMEAILEETAKAVPGVLSEPAPRAFVSGLKDSKIGYCLRFWVDDFVTAPYVEGRVLTYLWYAFKRRGIEIPSQRSLTKTDDSDRNKQRILAALHSIDFLSVLDAKAMDDLVQQAESRTYLPGEAVVHQGDQSSEMFFILEGHADVRIGEGADSVLATLNPLQFFGEMSLLTGERRSATIVAQTQLEVLVLTKEALVQPLKQNPVLIERMSEVLAKRKSEIVAHQERAARRSESDADRHTQARSLGARIRAFFGVAED
jgi:small-conductance mechanosensitive channel